MSDLSNPADSLPAFQPVYRTSMRGGGLNAKDTVHNEFDFDVDTHSSAAMGSLTASKAPNPRPLRERVIEGLREFASHLQRIPGKIGKALLSIAEAGVKLVPRLIGLVIGGLLGAVAGIVLWAPLAKLRIQQVKDAAIQKLGNTSIHEDSGYPMNNQWSDVKGLARHKAQAAICLAAVGAPLIVAFRAAHKGKEKADEAVDAAGKKIQNACFAVAQAVAKACGKSEEFTRYMREHASKHEE